MGCTNSTIIMNENTIKVATLNYCGIMNSPFQFYCEQFSKELKQLSNIFMIIIPLYKPNFQKDKFKWNMGKIDLKFRTGRYSPMFQLEIGFQNGKFMSRQQFQDRWDEVFKKKIQNAKCPYSQQQRIETRLYDLVTYHTLLHYVYGIKTLEEALSKDPRIYINKLKPFYELSFLNQQTKIKMMVKNLSKINADVIFFQQYSSQLYKYMVNRKQHYISIDPTNDTLIIAKEASFNKKKDAQLIFQPLSKQQKDDLKQWAQNMAVMVLDQYIFMSAHLSSKQQKNKRQIQLLKKNLISLRGSLPNYEIILGGDLNSYLQPFSKDFNIFPKTSNMLTTIKKRTMTQGQFNKGQKIIYQSKDKIISTLKLEDQQTKIMYITGKQPNRQSFIPSNQHPFDHFMIVALIIKKQTQV